ncbi:histone H1-like [Hoplias malabaricus]|uniref:histone H1-like n=1 Tax=Hoplias malabaricus TaxID=27720 RepID=UPI0034635F0C
MSEAAPALAVAPAKSPRRKSTKAKKSGPSVSDLILKVVSASKSRKGISLAVLKKGLATAGYDVVKNSFRVRLAVRRLLANGGLVQTKGTGASGSFKIGQKTAKKKTVKAKKPRAKKAKRTRAKKPATAKKSPKKTKRKSKSPKKAKRPGTKKTKSPRKTTRRTKAPAKQP